MTKPKQEMDGTTALTIFVIFGLLVSALFGVCFAEGCAKLLGS